MLQVCHLYAKVEFFGKYKNSIMLYKIIHEIVQVT